MNLNEVFFGGAGILVIIMSLFQIAPVKINPWTYIAKKIGTALNGELSTKVDNIYSDLSHEIGELKTGMTKLENITKDLEEKIDENEAVACRSRIIRFGDELYHKIDHTKEHFDQILADITKYQLYCDNHKNFKDTVAEMTIEQIKATYRDVFIEGRFL